MGRKSPPAAPHLLGHRPPLDGLRGIAVLLVLLGHFQLTEWGFAGVDVFFALSGFLITTLLYEEWQRGGRIGLLRFYRRRARRLLPALLLLLTAYSVAKTWFGLLGSEWSLRHQLVTTLFFANNWAAAAGHIGDLAVLGVTWSLAQEEQFYLLWPLAFWGLLRLRSRPAALLALVVGVIAVLVLVVPHTPPGEWAAAAHHGYFSPFTRVAELLVGCAAAVAWRLRPRPLHGVAQLPLLIATGFMALGIGCLAPELKYPGLAALAALAILTVLAVPKGILARLLSLRPLRYTGRISYGLYLYHMPVAEVIRELLPHLPRPVYILISAGLAFAVSAASWHLLEARFLKPRPPHPALSPPLPAPPPESLPAPRGPVRAVAADTEPPCADIVPLPEELNARRILGRGQSVVLGALLSLPVLIAVCRLATGRGPSALDWARWTVLAILLIDVVAVVGQSVLVLAARRAPVLRGRDLDPYGVPDDALPRYTVLVPLHQEHRILPDLVQYLSALNYPTDRLQILLLIENDDHLTLAALKKLTLGPQFRALLFTPSLPRTKPKACNIGLRHATGDLCVVYDAEDRPAPDQLRLAAAAFRRLPDDIVCVQAELQFWNPWTNWLTECFAAEYALRYSLVLHGLDRLRLPVPLGGTSNHFRTTALRDLGAWDPYNVTEDADLGMRLARRGLGTRMLASVTYEEANSEVGNWIRQRSRWIKGHIQTWLVHTRHPLRTWRELGTRGFLTLHFMLGLGPLVQLLNPALWLLTLYHILANVPGGTALLLPSPAHQMALPVMAVVNLMLIGHFAAACAVRRLHRSIPTMLSMPLIWLLMSLAAYKAVGQLLRPGRRHFWELTRHGLAPLTPADPEAPPPDDKPRLSAA